ncbi:unnamed protein product [Peniophora sp. CBMAI 1063]|nr:unnamed protein product [Peniophora sp. CBMAI 1063]
MAVRFNPHFHPPPPARTNAYGHDRIFGPPVIYLVHLDGTGLNYVEVLFTRGASPTVQQELRVIQVALLRWKDNQADRPYRNPGATQPRTDWKFPSQTPTGLDVSLVIVTRSVHQSQLSSRHEPPHITAFLANPREWTPHLLVEPDPVTGLLVPVRHRSGDQVVGRELGAALHIFDQTRVDPPYDQLVFVQNIQPFWHREERASTIIPRGTYRIVELLQPRVMSHTLDAYESARASCYDANGIIFPHLNVPPLQHPAGSHWAPPYGVDAPWA